MGAGLWQAILPDGSISEKVAEEEEKYRGDEIHT